MGVGVVAMLIVGASVVINVDAKPGVSRARAGVVGEALKSVVEALADVAVVLDYAPMATCGSRKKCLAEIREISQTDDVVLVSLQALGDEIAVSAERSKRRRARRIRGQINLSSASSDYEVALTRLVAVLFGLTELPVAAASKGEARSKPPAPAGRSTAASASGRTADAGRASVTPREAPGARRAPPPSGSDPPAAVETAPNPELITAAPPDADDDSGASLWWLWLLAGAAAVAAGAGAGAYVLLSDRPVEEYEARVTW